MTNLFVWFAEHISNKKISVHAAQVAFFLLVSIFPFLMFTITLLRYTPLNEEVLLRIVQEIVPSSLSTLVMDWLKETYASASSTVLSVTVIFTLWPGSKGFSGIIYELEEIYEVEERRGIIGRRIHSILDTVVFTLMLILSLILLVYGNQIIQIIHRLVPFLSNLDLILFILRSAVAFLVFVTYFVVLYRFVPNRRSTIRDELPGAGLAAFLWIVFSYIYSIYIDYHHSFSSVYGSLTYIVLIMIWMYGSITIIFFGALFNQYLKEEKRLNFIHSVRQLPSILFSFLGNKK